MAKEFELREAGTGRLLGTLRMVEDCAPGAVVLAFKQDRVQVERVARALLEPEPEPALVAAGQPDRPAKGKGRRR